MIVYSREGPALDSIAAHLLSEDILHVTGIQPGIVTDVSAVRGNVIVIGNIGSNLVQNFLGKKALLKSLEGKWECFGLKIINNPNSDISKAFVIAGSDARGTAYGVFTLSEKIGVSPWYWWADVPVKKQPQLIIHQPEYISSTPSVKFRGIFINDEDWGLRPWAAKTFEPGVNNIGPKTYAKVFELLLRLKANLIWPAMHPGTDAFFSVHGNKETAAKYDIVIGSSHAEPMLRNNVGEWDEKTMGHFNYITNKEKVDRYWEERVKESRGNDVIYSLGMRGVHDGQMEGVKTAKEAVPLLEQIFDDQRDMLKKYYHKDIASIPQVFTPYKEVLEFYDHGLKVPDDVTLVWPDDNYGYIQRLGNDEEKKRSGGAGIYYHASYWGRPHDYLWLPSTNPALMREEMVKAYEAGADRLWVLNVGDIKPIEYNTQEFLDMAYYINPFKESNYSKQHLLQWAGLNFGKERASKIQSVVWEYFQLAFERRPESMGWSQVEPETNVNYTAYDHFYFGDEAQKRIDKYDVLVSEVKKIRSQIDPTKSGAFYELVSYPVITAAWMNKKFLYRDKAYFYSKQNRMSAYDYVRLSKNAYDSIIEETEYYNTNLAGGKWNYMMTMNPRNLPAYRTPELPEITIKRTKSWSVSPEGYDTIVLNDFILPAFTEGLKQSFFVDVFLSDSTTIKWSAIPSYDWIKLSVLRGTLLPGKNKGQERIWVTVNWDKVPQTEKNNGEIIFNGAGRLYKVKVHAIRLPELKNYRGFVESNGYVSIYAQHYSVLRNGPGYKWKMVDGLGHTGASMMTGLSSTITTSADTTSIKRLASFLSYDFYTYTETVPQVVICTLPTLPLNKDHGMRYAISVDDGPAQIVESKSNSIARTEEWKQNVLHNEAVRKVSGNFLKIGKHTLKIFAIDPGLILDRIVIDLGGAKNAYSPVPETRR